MLSGEVDDSTVAVSNTHGKFIMSNSADDSAKDNLPNNMNADCVQPRSVRSGSITSEVSRFSISNENKLLQTKGTAGVNKTKIFDDDVSLEIDDSNNGILATRREQFQAFLNDVSRGFSLNFSLQRFQNLVYINQNNKNNIRISGTENEPSGVDKVTEPSVSPIINDVVYPKLSLRNNSKPKKISKSIRKRRKRLTRDLSQYDSESDCYYFSSPCDREGFESAAIDSKTRLEALRLFDNYRSYVYVDAEEYKSPDLLRRRILAITRIPGLSDKHKGILVQKLMLGRINSFASREGSIAVDNGRKEKFSDSQESDFYDQDSYEDYDSYEEEEDDDDGIFGGSTHPGEFLDEEERISYFDVNEEILGCQHYQAGCKSECPTCLRFYTCRLCHDLTEPTHTMERSEVRSIACMKCGKIQPPDQECIECNFVFAEYFCEKCKLYDNDINKNIYHCDDCGICRLGCGLGIDYFHCHGCNACISILLENDHQCMENRTKCNCPICGDYLFTSQKKVVVMPCSHAIHQHCYNQFVEKFYKCPICSKTIIDMKARFREIDNEISLQPMPEPYNLWKCVINCNDCLTNSVCNYHVLGLKCAICQSYNTSQLKLLKPKINGSSINDELNGGEYTYDMGNMNDVVVSTADSNTYSNNNGNITLNKDLFNKFFNENSERVEKESGKAKNDLMKVKTKEKIENPKQVKTRRRKNTLKRSDALPKGIPLEDVGFSKFANNIKNIISSATESTNNYYNDFIQATLESLENVEDSVSDSDTSDKDGGIVKFKKINRINIFGNRTESLTDFEISNETNKTSIADGARKMLSYIPYNKLQKMYESEPEPSITYPTFGEVLKKWANSTAGISDSDDYDIDDLEEDEED